VDKTSHAPSGHGSLGRVSQGVALGCQLPPLRGSDAFEQTSPARVTRFGVDDLSCDPCRGRGGGQVMVAVQRPRHGLRRSE
jgi:hypothetical protein